MPQAFRSIFILADDLSGAADCALGAARQGLDSVVLFDASAKVQAQVVAVDSNSRYLSAERAQEVNTAYWKQNVKPGCLLYKKIDSTLRGNFASEISALSKFGLAIVAPAFPSAGRTIVDGRVFVHGAALETTEIWINEKIQGDADIPAILNAHGLASTKVSLATIRGGNLSAELASLVAEGVAQAVVCDAQDEADLAAIAAASIDLPVYWVGSAGLLPHLVAATSLTNTSKSPELSVDGPILTVVGSLSGVSRQQADELEALVRLQVVEIDTGMLLQDDRSLLWNSVSDQIGKTLSSGKDLMLRFVSDQSSDLSDGPLLCQALGQLVKPWMGSIGALIATGGETARELLSAFNSFGLQVVREVEPGVPLSIALGDKPKPVITKAGAFGSPTTLLKCHAELSAMRSRAKNDHRGINVMYKPIIAITMGDAAGVGPEVIMKSLAHEALFDRCRPLVIGDATRLRTAAKIVGVDLTVNPVSGPGDAQFKAGVVDCLDLSMIPADLPFGQLSAVAGHAAYLFIAKAVELAQTDLVDAICTAPLNKEALHAGGHPFPGHTEILAELTSTPEVSMMLVAPNLRVIHVTTHIGLIDAINRIEPGLVERTIARGHTTLVRAGIANPRIGVCAINPHAGENGLFGHGEEESKIIPAITACQAKGWNVEGPLPADTLFFRAGRGDFDLVVAMYHDQGHGPIKVLGIEAGVNITVGLPVIRTSVDHGTAFDIAGQGIVDERSMLEALRQAIELAVRRDDSRLKGAAVKSAAECH